VLGDRALQVVVDHAWLDQGQPVGRVDAQDAVHALEGDDDAVALRHRGAGGAGAEPAGGDRDTMAVDRGPPRPATWPRR
jgi:hypothetical protein